MPFSFCSFTPNQPLWLHQDSNLTMALELYNTLDSNMYASWTSSHQNLTSSFMPIHFCQHVQILLTFTISIISGHSDFYNFYCIRTFRLLIFTISITSKYSDFADFDNFYQDIQTFTISIIPGHSDFADFHNFYQDIQTLLTFTISVISGHSDFADFDILKRVWLQMFWLKSPLPATSNNNINSSNTQDSG